MVGWAVGTAAGTAMAFSANLSTTYTVAIGGYTFPGYTAFFTVILNLVIAVVLTPVFNAMRSGAAPKDVTVAAVRGLGGMHRAGGILQVRHVHM